MEGLQDAAGWVAVGAAAFALLTLILVVALSLRLRRLRSDQRLLLGEETGTDDIVEHAVRLERGFRELHDYVKETASRLDGRVSAVERWLDGAIVYRSIVRYDAFNEMSGRQSCSIALLDATRSGIILTHLMRRDQARLYIRQIVRGEGEHELAPEEQEAVRLAIAQGVVLAEGSEQPVWAETVLGEEDEGAEA